MKNQYEYLMHCSRYLEEHSRYLEEQAKKKKK